MAKVHVCNVLVRDNPSTFLSNLEFEITFDSIEDLAEDLGRRKEDEQEGNRQVMVM